MTDAEKFTEAGSRALKVLPTATGEIIADEMYEASDYVAAGGRANPSRLLCAEEILALPGTAETAFLRSTVRTYELQMAEIREAAGLDEWGTVPEIVDKLKTVDSRMVEALDLIEEMRGYVPAYFAEKWNMDDRVETLRVRKERRE